VQLGVPWRHHLFAPILCGEACGVFLGADSEPALESAAAMEARRTPLPPVAELSPVGTSEDVATGEADAVAAEAQSAHSGTMPDGMDHSSAIKVLPTAVSNSAPGI